MDYEGMRNGNVEEEGVPKMGRTKTVNDQRRR